MEKEHLKRRSKCDEKLSIGRDDFKLAVEIEMQECESLDEPANASESTDNTGSDPWALTELADTSEKWSGKVLRNAFNAEKPSRQCELFLLFIARVNHARGKPFAVCDALPARNVTLVARAFRN